jgi:hypothetical protein
MSTGTVKAFPISGTMDLVDAEEKENLRAKIKSRRTNEIIIGVCGAVGCNLHDVVNELKEQFGSFSYEVHLVKISKIIKEYFIKNTPPASYLGKISDIENLSLSDRYQALQDLGNFISNAL